MEQHLCKMLDHLGGILQIANTERPIFLFQRHDAIIIFQFCTPAAPLMTIAFAVYSCDQFRGRGYGASCTQGDDGTTT